MRRINNKFYRQLGKMTNRKKMNNYLPEINNMPREIRKGRCVYEGYQRGWGLQFDDLAQQVLSDPLYNEALSLCQDRTILTEHNRMNIFLLLRFFLGKIPSGHIIEFGAFRGGNAIFMAHVVNKLYPGMMVYALDSFEGMPKTDKSVDAHNENDFSNTNYEELVERVEYLGMKNLKIVKGYFEDTAEALVKEAGSFSLAHIDCDIKPAVEYSYEIIKKHMVEGGYFVFDDANVSSCIGATEVVEDLVIRRDQMNSEQIYPHYVFRNFVK